MTHQDMKGRGRKQGPSSRPIACGHQACGAALTPAPFPASPGLPPLSPPGLFPGLVSHVQSGGLCVGAPSQACPRLPVTRSRRRPLRSCPTAVTNLPAGLPWSHTRSPGRECLMASPGRGVCHNWSWPLWWCQATSQGWRLTSGAGCGPALATGGAPSPCPAFPVGAHILPIFLSRY